MSSYCTIHNAQMYPSKFEEGKFYHFTGEITEDGKKVSCKGEGLGKAVSNGNATDGQFNSDVKPSPVAPKKHDGMLQCNAMNNAVALAVAGNIDIALIADWYHNLLAELEN